MSTPDPHDGTVLFVGPTMTAAEVSAALPGASVRPPAARGDVYRAAHGGARVIGIVDGVFERVPSIWHKEVLDALEKGVHVLGSSSMGALRAAELDVFGMVGVGHIYELVRDGQLDDDDVAVAHASAENHYRSLSTALVDIRANLEVATAAGVLDPARAAELLAAQKATFYTDRSSSDVLTHARAIDPVLGEALASWWADNSFSQKHRDACQLIGHVADLAESQPLDRRPQMLRTIYFEQMVREEVGFAGDDPHDGWAHPVLEELQIDPAHYREVAARASEARHARELAHLCGHEVDQVLVDATADELRRRLGLFEADQLFGWLDDQGLTMDDFAALVGRRARSAVGAGRLPSLPIEDLVDELRLAGSWSQLAERSADKARALREAGWDEAGTAPGNTDRQRALTWWLDRHFPGEHPSDVDDLARRLGFGDRQRLMGAALREFRYAAAVGVDRSGQDLAS